MDHRRKLRMNNLIAPFSLHFERETKQDELFFQLKSWILCAWICPTLFIVSARGSSGVHTLDSFIVDESGRRRIDHGVHFGEKQFPWYPQKLLDPIEVSTLAEHGWNFVRLGWDRRSLDLLRASIDGRLFRMMWSGAKSESRKYNTAYLTPMKDIVSLLEESQIFVSLDIRVWWVLLNYSRSKTRWPKVSIQSNESALSWIAHHF